MAHYTFEEIHQLINGRWQDVLSAIGIAQQHLTDRHGPCPGCGGTDRFRFDDIEGRGTWFCGGGGDAKSGDGFALIVHVFGCSLPDALAKVASHLGITSKTQNLSKQIAELTAKNRQWRDALAKKETQAIAETVLEAEKIWAASQPAHNNHPYLSAKSVKSYGLRMRQHSGVDELLLPLIDIEGQLRNLERILPPNQNLKGNKFALGPGLNGLFHLIGERLDTLRDRAQPLFIVIAEGYATAASIHMASHYPVVVARSASNIPNVLNAFRKTFPDALIVLALDNDKAGQAVENSVQLCAKTTTIKPHFDEADLKREFESGNTCKDFNDYHRIKGLTAVAEAIEHAASMLQSPKPKSDQVNQSESVEVNDKVKSIGAFRLSSQGLYYAKDDDTEGDIYVCSPIEIIALTRDSQCDNWGVLVHFNDLDGNQKELNIPTRLLHKEGALDAISALVDAGLIIGSGKRCKPLLIAYLKQTSTSDRVTIVHKLGWNGEAFMLPYQTIGTSANRLMFEKRNRITNPAKCGGTLEGWQKEIAAYAIGNPRLMFSICVAFAAPLLELIGAESGGFHFYGPSSLGKTTLLNVASSVWGGPGYMQTWRATDNALESICSAYSDCLLPLDELGQCAAEIAGETVYMIGNGRGKARANESGLLKRNSAEWRLLFLSTGEKTLEQHLSEGGRTLKAGMEVRMIAIPADAGKSLGLFDTIVFSDIDVWASASKLAQHLSAASTRHFGHAAHAFLNNLVVNRNHAINQIKNAQSQFARCCDKDANGQVLRAANRFALAGIAGELASKWGITGWKAGTAMGAAKTCFTAWIEQRGGIGSFEFDKMKMQVRQFFTKYRYSHFREWSRADDDHAPASRDCAGYVRTFGKNQRQQANELEHTEFYVFPDTFRFDICKGIDYRMVEKWLLSINALRAERNGEKSLSMTRSERVPGLAKRQRFYVITENVFSDPQTEVSKEG